MEDDIARHLSGPRGRLRRHRRNRRGGPPADRRAPRTDLDLERSSYNPALAWAGGLHRAGPPGHRAAGSRTDAGAAPRLGALARTAMGWAAGRCETGVCAPPERPPTVRAAGRGMAARIRCGRSRSLLVAPGRGRAGGMPPGPAGVQGRILGVEGTAPAGSRARPRRTVQRLHVSNYGAPAPDTGF